MVIMESNNLVPFLVEHKLVGAHCTVIIDRVTMCADYIVVDDTCIHEYNEHKLKYIYFEPQDTLTFSFEVPATIQFAGQGASVRISVQPGNQMAEMICDKPYFSSIVKLNDNHADRIKYDTSGNFMSLKPYSAVIKAVKNLKSLATELSTSISVELGPTYWTVSVSQCCVFGAIKGIQGSITSQLLEKVYDYESEVLQASPTSLILRKRMTNGDSHIIHVPVSKQVELPNVIDKMVIKCKDVCTSVLTADVGMITGEIIRNIKKDVITLCLREGRMDLKYSNNNVTLSTEPRGGMPEKAMNIQIPIKSLISVVDMLEKPTSISTNGEYLCMMRDNKGLLISGIIS